jgi:hypothetical protein
LEFIGSVILLIGSAIWLGETHGTASAGETLNGPAVKVGFAHTAKPHTFLAGAILWAIGSFIFFLGELILLSMSLARN